MRRHANITGIPTITAPGSHHPADAAGDGSIPDNAAISIVNRSYPGGVPSMNITGAPLVTAADGVDALQVYTWNSSDKTTQPWAEAMINVSISGGMFSSDPSAYLADGYTATLEDGMYSVIPN